jgi:dethiobiotin synthetase
MSAVFVTATGTEIGKTFVTAALIRHMRGAGHAVHAIKPVVTGFDQEAWQNTDPAALLAALARPISLQEIEGISPWRFKAPLSPDMAGRREGRTIAFAQVIEFCRHTLRNHPGMVLIEGIGGIMVPLDEHRTVLDWMSVLRLPIILVAGTYVGSISHTLTSLEVLARRNLNVAAVAVSESEASAASLDDTVATFERFADAITVVGIPRLAAGVMGHLAFAQISALILAESGFS